MAKNVKLGPAALPLDAALPDADAGAPEPLPPAGPGPPASASGSAASSGSAAGPSFAFFAILLGLAALIGTTSVCRTALVPVRGARLGGALSRAPPAV